MAVSFTIAGTPIDLQPGWRVSEQMNGRNVMTGSVVSLAGTYRPAARAVTEFTDGSTVYFKGLIHDLDEGGLGGYGATPIEVVFGATDYNIYADNRQMELTIPAGGYLKDGLTKIATALAGYGVTLNATQANGPQFTEEFVLELDTISAILDKLSVATGYDWNIGGDTYTKVLSMSSPGTVPAGTANNAPFNIASGNGYAIGDITVKPSLSDFANVVYVRYSSAPTTAYAFFEMTGNPSNTQTVTVGGKTYTFQDTLTNVDGNVQIDASYLVTITNLQRAITLQGTPGTDYATLMTVNAQVTAGMQSNSSILVVALQAGTGGNAIACTETCANATWRTEGGGTTTTLLFGTDETMNLWVIAPQDLASMPAPADRVDRTVNHSEIRDKSTAQLMADGYLARYLQVPNEIHYRTLTNGLHPGMQQSIVEAKRNLNSANCLITNVEASAVGNVVWYDITAVDALVIPANGMEFWDVGGGGSGGVSGGVGVGGSSTGSAEVYVCLGGSDSAALSFAASPAYTPVINSTPFFAKTSFTGRVRVWLWSRIGGVTVTARLYDVTAASAVGSVGTTGTSRPASPQTLDIVITATHQYRLDIISSVASEDCYGIGTLETL